MRLASRLFFRGSSLPSRSHKSLQHIKGLFRCQESRLAVTLLGMSVGVPFWKPMARIVGIGHQDFETVITKGIFYIDKTAFKTFKQFPSPSIIYRKKFLQHTHVQRLAKERFPIPEDRSVR